MPSSSSSPTMSSIKKNDPMFKELLAIQPTLARGNQDLVPVLIKVFGDFHTKIVADLTTKFNAMTNKIKEEHSKVCKAKDDKTSALKTECTKLQARCQELEEKLDASEAYSRKDSIIISGDLPAVSSQENLKELSVELLNRKLPECKVEAQDISICHRLQTKKPKPGQVAKPPNIYIKLVRRDVKQALVLSSKKQPRQGTNKIFVNESLTPTRSKVLHTLVDLKKKHGSIKGVTSMDGHVYAYTAAPPGAASSQTGRPQDVRHRINTDRELQKFCDQHLQKPLERLLESSSEA